MQFIIDFLFAQYAEYSTLHIVLEIIAVLFSVISVFYSRINHIWVYPTGIIGTTIFVYLLFQWGLLGDMIVNFYYTVMSIYGWYIWTKKVDATHTTPITTLQRRQLPQLIALMIASASFVAVIYIVFDKLQVEQYPWIPYIDILTTAIFFAGMWLMAKRKIEHWYFWIVANAISIPLYFIKGYSFSSFLYVILLLLAILGIIEWKRLYKQEQLKTNMSE